MGKSIAIIQGHPDASGRHVCHALADEYAKGTEDGGHEVKRIEAARLDFPILRTKGEFEKGALPYHLDLCRRPSVGLIIWFFFAHSLKSLERNILGFSGIGPIKARLTGTIEGMTEKQRAGWLDEMRGLGDLGKSGGLIILG